MSKERPSRPPREQLTPNRFRFWTCEKIRNADTDQFHHVNNASIASYLEAGRMEIFASPAISRLMEGLNVVVGRLNTEFYAEIFYPGELNIGSTITRIGRCSFEVLQGIFRGESCVASAVASCVLLQTGKPHPISNDVRQHLLSERVDILPSNGVL